MHAQPGGAIQTVPGGAMWYGGGGGDGGDGGSGGGGGDGGGDDGDAGVHGSNLRPKLPRRPPNVGARAAAVCISKRRR